MNKLMDQPIIFKQRRSIKERHWRMKCKKSLMTSYRYSILISFSITSIISILHPSIYTCLYPLHNCHKASPHLVLCQVLFYSLAPPLLTLWLLLVHLLQQAPQAQLPAVSIPAAKAWDHRELWHTHTHTPSTFLVWHPSGKSWFCVLCMFVHEHSSSDRRIGKRISLLLIGYFVHFFLLLISLAVMFLH